MTIYNETVPYIYKWTQISTKKWYIGSKIRKGWNPSRHEEYICSSKEVKPERSLPIMEKNMMIVEDTSRV